MGSNVPRKLTVTARTIFPPLHKAQIVSEGESQGRHLHVDTGGGFTSKHDRRGPKGQLPCILDRQRRLPRTLRDHVRSASALSALKKSLVANLSAKRQLSVAKLSAKRIFSLAKRDFLVANGRMAADFSSPGLCKRLKNQTTYGPPESLSSVSKRENWYVAHCRAQGGGEVEWRFCRIPELKWRWGSFTFKTYARKKRGNPISGGPFALPAILSGHIILHKRHYRQIFLHLSTRNPISNAHKLLLLLLLL